MMESPIRPDPLFMETENNSDLNHLWVSLEKLIKRSKEGWQFTIKKTKEGIYEWWVSFRKVF